MVQDHARLLVLVLTVAVSFAQAAVAGARDANELAAQIDRRLENHWKADKIQPAPRADDAEFLRRVSLDITGHIRRCGLTIPAGHPAGMRSVS